MLAGPRTPAAGTGRRPTGTRSSVQPTGSPGYGRPVPGPYVDQQRPARSVFIDIKAAKKGLWDALRQGHRTGKTYHGPSSCRGRNGGARFLRAASRPEGQSGALFMSARGCYGGRSPFAANDAGATETGLSLDDKKVSATVDWCAVKLIGPGLQQPAPGAENTSRGGGKVAVPADGGQELSTRSEQGTETAGGSLTQGPRVVRADEGRRSSTPPPWLRRTTHRRRGNLFREVGGGITLRSDLPKWLADGHGSIGSSMGRIAVGRRTGQGARTWRSVHDSQGTGRYRGPRLRQRNAKHILCWTRTGHHRGDDRTAASGLGQDPCRAAKELKGGGGACLGGWPGSEYDPKGKKRNEKKRACCRGMKMTLGNCTAWLVGPQVTRGTGARNFSGNSQGPCAGFALGATRYSSTQVHGPPPVGSSNRGLRDMLTLWRRRGPSGL